MQVTQTLRKTEYWVNFREECAAYIEKHLKDKSVSIELVAIIPKKEGVVFTPPKIDAYTPIHNDDVEFILEERASIFCEEVKIPYEWAAAILQLNLRQKPLSMSDERWNNIKAALNLLCENNCKILKSIISYDWSIADIFGCYKQQPEKVYSSMGLLMLLNDGSRIVEVSNHFIKTKNKRGGVLSYSRPYFGYHIQQILIHDLP
jgi:hypothetical protein